MVGVWERVIFQVRHPEFCKKKKGDFLRKRTGVNRPNRERGHDASCPCGENQTLVEKRNGFVYFYREK